MNTPFGVLVVEDNVSMKLGMTESLRREGYQVHDFENGVDALAFFEANVDRIHVGVLDLKMEPINGVAVLRRMKELAPQTEVLMVSAFGTVEAAVESMQVGAGDFLTKPFSSEELRIRVRRLCEKIQRERDLVRLAEENRFLQDELSLHYDDMVGHSAPMKKIYEVIDRVAGEDSTILIEGESGTGKELVARAIHRKSRRADRPFIKVNCGALNDNLLESELFGHEKGAFTGAIRQRKGRFELAHGGTLFLDEVGDVSLPMQVKLLRVLQEKEFERVGGEETFHADVRLVAATHRDLSRMVAEEKFRDDLYYRLRVIPIQLPPVRERKEDIPALVEHFLGKMASTRHAAPKKLAAGGIERLCQYAWPGNIRELENLIERLCVISPGDTIETALIIQHLNPGHAGPADGSVVPLEETLLAFEKRLILDALKAANGVKNKAAKMLGIKTSTLYSKMERLGIPQ